VTHPLPIPEELEEMVIHATLLAAVQRQVLAVEMFTKPAPSFANTASSVGEIEYVHAGAGGGVGGDGGVGGGGGAGFAACVMSDCWPATLIDPLRCAPSLSRTT
jgi:hypothetical protein